MESESRGGGDREGESERKERGDIEDESEKRWREEWETARREGGTVRRE